uniref:Biotin carboxyl carrier protein of acetyl-CoA carboxylase n=1 Tax=Noccaea caerulescens TaxID=107243 RepID=A0A1J3JMM5_NOCCA
MASSSFSLTSPAASVYAVTQTSAHFPLPSRSRLPRRVSFRLSAKPKLRFLSKPSRSSYPVVKAQSNKVGSGASSNASASAKIDGPSAEGKDKNSLKDDSSSSSSSPNLATEESISEFLTQVTTLVKLVDSRDIVELQLKQLDCELVIRKKEALPQPQSPTPYVMMQQPNQPSYVQQMAPPSAPAASPAPSAPPSLPPPTPTTPAKSSLPTVKSPMAGTFYRSPGPGEPPFIKVGDKVQKGQVLCIVEAMKLMNEIESDQTGTVVDIVAEDGKPVSLDTPLFVVQP